MANRNLTMVRLQKQEQKILKNPIKNCLIRRKDVLNFHFCIYGLDGDYQGGYYHGVLELSPQYPFAPPVLKFITPNGRFEVNTAICTTFTNYHKQTWSTAWNVETMILATISFLQTNQNTAGAVQTSSSKKRLLAKNSLKWNLLNEEFNIFPLEQFENYREIVQMKQNLSKSPQEHKIQQKINNQENKLSGLLMKALGVLIIGYGIYKWLGY